jgi:hypothetical protein
MDDGFQRELDKEFAKSPRIDGQRIPLRVFILVLAAVIASLLAFAALTS